MEVTTSLVNSRSPCELERQIDQLLKKIKRVEARCASERKDLHQALSQVKDLSVQSRGSPNRLSSPEEAGKRNTGDNLAAQGRFLKDAAFRP